MTQDKECNMLLVTQFFCCAETRGKRKAQRSFFSVQEVKSLSFFGSLCLLVMAIFLLEKWSKLLWRMISMDQTVGSHKSIHTLEEICILLVKNERLRDLLFLIAILSKEDDSRRLHFPRNALGVKICSGQPSALRIPSFSILWTF